MSALPGHISRPRRLLLEAENSLGSVALERTLSSHRSQAKLLKEHDGLGSVRLSFFSNAGVLRITIYPFRCCGTQTSVASGE